MTINIDVYCKKRPKVTSLIDRLGWQATDYLEGYEAYRWVPTAGGNGIFIILKKVPEIYSGSFDREIIDQNIRLARFAGIDVPEDLTDKFRRDNLSYNSGVCTLAVEGKESSARKPLTAEPSCTDDDAYTIRADHGLYQLATRFPHLENVDPWFRLPFGLAKFARGRPLYNVGFETTVTVTEDTLRNMTRLAGYFAKKWDGIVYDTDHDRFGIPDAEVLHNEGMELFTALASQGKKDGFIVKPADF
jgi:hypothetical protein